MRRRVTQPVKLFRASLFASATVLEIETGSMAPGSAITLETPAVGFIKGVAMEGFGGGACGGAWKKLADGQPIFRQANGVARLTLTLPDGPWERVRVTIDDHRSEPVPFTGAEISPDMVDAPIGEWTAATIVDRKEEGIGNAPDD